MSPQPNILVFMTDHQRGDTVLPGSRCLMPNLERFRSQGLTFSQTFCPTPHCCPARATFMTGLYPTRHGVWNNICNGQALRTEPYDGVRMWSDDLADAGYRMAWSGKWHVSMAESPKDRGFDELYVTAKAGDHHGPRWDRYKQMAAAAEPQRDDRNQILRPGYPPFRVYGSLGDGFHPHDETTLQHAVDALPKLAGGKDPWAMYVGPVLPHDPYTVPQKYLDMYRLEDVPLPPSYNDAMSDKPRIYQRIRNMRYDQLGPEKTRDAIRHFWACCTYLDDMFGRLMAALEASGQAENTLVLYTSDHGDYCGDHGLFAKGVPCFRGAYHVPAVVRWPKEISNPGRTVDQFVSLADFAPTFTEAATGRSDGGLSGASLLPFLRGQSPAGWRDEIHTQCNGVELYYTQRSVTTRDWKYVFNGFDNDELYDLRNDPHEMRNLAADPAMKDVVRSMCQRMWRFAHAQNDTAINDYITVALAPYGPAEAFRG